MKCRCGRNMWFQQALFGEEGYYICTKCGRSSESKQTVKRPSPKTTKVIDYAELQKRLFHYVDKKAELDKQIREHGADQELIKERAWCEFVRKQNEKDLGLLGIVYE